MVRGTWWVGGLLVAAGMSSLSAGDWPQWRGPNADGRAGAGDWPVRWSATEQVLWKVALPGKGCSTPVVMDGRIVLTAPVDGDDAVLAFDRAGKSLWQVRLGPETKGRHRAESGSNPSVAAGDDGFFATFRSGRLVALDPAGKVRWQQDLTQLYGADTLYWAYGSSPVLTAEHVIASRLHHGGSWLAAFDRQSGELAWKVVRDYATPPENDNAYSTPLLLRRDGREILLTWAAEHLTAHAAADGKLLWSCGGFNPEGEKNWPVVASPVVAGEMALVSFGRSDRKQPQLHGVRLGGKGDVTASHRAWSRDDTGSFVPTPAVADGRVYLLQDLGRLDCIEPATGKILWSHELPRSQAKFYASPLVAGDLLYATREDGTTLVGRIAAGGFQLLAENPLDEQVIASPVPVGGQLLIRGEKHLFCIGAR